MERLKKWPSAWKINLIRTDNPDWKDLATDWYSPEPTPEVVENGSPGSRKKARPGDDERGI
jgi:hypothetical protein